MIDTAKDALKSDEIALRKELEAAGAQFRGRACRCIFCEDKHPSAGIYCHDGMWYYKCQKCGVHYDIIAVRAALTGKKPGEVLRDMAPTTARPSPAPKPKPVFPDIPALIASVSGYEAHYVYTHPDTQKPDMVVIRFRQPDGKHFYQARPVPGGFIMEKPTGLLPLYNRQRVRAARDVVVVEGEKCVHALHRVGIVATTSPGGALNGDKADWSPLAAKNVWLWPDNDAPEPPKYSEGKGVFYQRTVFELLQKLEPRPQIHWIDPTALQLPVKGDAVDFLDRLTEFDDAMKGDVVRDVMADAPLLDMTAKLHGLMEEIIAGKLRAYNWPWPALGGLSNCLTPGTVTVLCGEGGSTKSLLLLEALTWWVGQGVRAVIYELEDDREYHLRRILAQIDKNSELTVNGWVESHPNETRMAMVRHQAGLDTMARCIWEAPNEQKTLDELAAWTLDRAKDGAEIIIIDPVTAAVPSAKPWVEDSKFVLEIKTIAREFNTRVILATHPKLGQKNQHGLDGLAGGAAYPRFCHTVLWLNYYDAPKSMLCKCRIGDASCMVDRVVEIRKARNGRGGKRIGLLFDYASLRFSEQGMIVSDD